MRRHLNLRYAHFCTVTLLLLLGSPLSGTAQADTPEPLSLPICMLPVSSVESLRMRSYFEQASATAEPDRIRSVIRLPLAAPDVRSEPEALNHVFETAMRGGHLEWTHFQRSTPSGMIAIVYHVRLELPLKKYLYKAWEPLQVSALELGGERLEVKPEQLEQTETHLLIDFGNQAGPHLLRAIREQQPLRIRFAADTEQTAPVTLIYNFPEPGLLGTRLYEQLQNLVNNQARGQCEIVVRHEDERVAFSSQ